MSYIRDNADAPMVQVVLGCGPNQEGDMEVAVDFGNVDSRQGDIPSTQKVPQDYKPTGGRLSGPRAGRVSYTSDPTELPLSWASGDTRKGLSWHEASQLFPLPQPQVSSLTLQWALLSAQPPPRPTPTHSQEYIAVTIEEAAKGAGRNWYHLHGLGREGRSEGLA